MPEISRTPLKISKKTRKRSFLFQKGWGRYIYKIFPVLFLTIPLSAWAGVSISEIMYDAPGADSGREWIEIQNPENTPVDIAGWKLFEGGVNHKIVPQKGSVIPAGGFAVIASDVEKFRAVYPGFSGTLFQSSFSLNNTGEALSVKNASSSEMASAAYSADGAVAGNTLNMIDGSFKARKPTPGAAASLETVSPAPLKTASKTGNVKASSRVSKSDGAAYDGVVAISGTDELASAAAAEKGNSQSFAMLPWIAALIAVIGIAAAALFLKGKSSPEGSGYTIIEEK